MVTFEYVFFYLCPAKKAVCDIQNNSKIQKDARTFLTPERFNVLLKTGASHVYLLAENFRSCSHDVPALLMTPLLVKRVKVCGKCVYHK